MKLKSILFFLLVSLLFASCSDDDNDTQKRVSNFDVPELTLENSIQFTVNTKENPNIQLYISGKKVAVDWGDGSEIEKDDLTQNRGDGHYDFREVFTHKYNTDKAYVIKVWSAEVTEFSLTTYILNQSYSFDDLKMGYCPLLEVLRLEDFTSTELAFNSNTPNLKTLGLQKMENMTSLDLKGLSNLEKLNMTNLAKLKQLDVSGNRKLWELNCYTIPELDNITFSNNTNLTWLTLSGCEKLTNIALDGAPNLVNLKLYAIPITSLDLSKLVELATLSFSETNLDVIDFSKNTKLYELIITNNNLTTLDITNNANLRDLHCTKNNLESLGLSQNKNLEYVNLANNQFSAESLNTIFTALPKSKYAKARSVGPPPECRIAFYDNPGSENCDTKIIKDKEWIIVE